MSVKLQDEKAPAKSLKNLFEPASVAVIGASRRKEAVGYAILNNLVTAGFKGPVYPINPKATDIDGLACFPSINDVKNPVDLAVLIIQSDSVPEVLKACGEKGIRSAIIISAGFREVGGQGIKLEKQVAELVKQYQMTVLGPNCLGLINTDERNPLNASFSRTMPSSGNIAFVSQSGALCTAILDFAKGEKIGFSKFVSFGNKVDVNELDLLRYLKDDSKTDVILMYVEDIVDGNAFIDVARDITSDPSKGKPIVAIKAGRTAQGAKAASSHTGSLMGSDEVYEAIFAQAGVLRVNSVEGLFNVALGFAYQPVPKGPRVAIVTNAGGPGIMATDACVRYGLEMAEISSETKDALKPVLPPTANFSNPIDVIGDAQQDRYEHAMNCVLNDPNVDSAIVVLTPQAMTDIDGTANAIVRMKEKSAKTMLACFMGSVDVAPGIKILQEHKIPQYKFPEEAAFTLGAMVRHSHWMGRPRTQVRVFSVDWPVVKTVFDDVKAKKQTLLNAYQSMKVLKAYGFPVLPFDLAKNGIEARTKAQEIGFPVVLKIVSPDIVHKLDVGGVRLNLQQAGDVESAFNEMTSAVRQRNPQAEIEGVFVQAMGVKGREVILGMNRDAHFGPVLMFGLGGTYVEVMKDVIFRLAPIRELTARKMIESIRTYAILKGVRGQNPADIDAIAESIERLSQLACDHPEIAEIDINPLVVYDVDQGARVIDARIILKY